MGGKNKSTFRVLVKAGAWALKHPLGFGKGCVTPLLIRVISLNKKKMFNMDKRSK